MAERMFYGLSFQRSFTFHSRNKWRQVLSTSISSLLLVFASDLRPKYMALLYFMLNNVFALQTPLSWQSKWDGPEDPMQYLRGLVTRAQAIQTWVEKAESGRLLQETLDLSELFHPDTFLNALRQQTARFVVYNLKW